MTYVISNIDNQPYLVRNNPDKQMAANTLAKLRQNFIKLSDHLFLRREDKELADYTQYINRLHERVHNIIIVESTQDSIYTSYSINKGEQIVFCLRSRKLLNQLHDINLMMYVCLHEISHVASPSYEPEHGNHGPIFKKVFSFILDQAEKINIYKKINFREKSEEYCGLIISDSV
jgi:predicted metal-dependent hydrolase